MPKKGGACKASSNGFSRLNIVPLIGAYLQFIGGNRDPMRPLAWSLK